MQTKTTMYGGPVPLLDLPAQLAGIRDDVLAAIGRVVESQHFILGAEVAALEREICDLTSSDAAVGVSSGTDALLVSLMALDVGRDDEVITSPFSFFSTAGSIARLGARPVFVDIRPHDFNIDPTKVEAAITSRTRAILPVHLFGQMADMPPILEIAQPRGIAVVEDAAQAIGAQHHGRGAGSFGRLGCFSFYPTKNLGAFGDGGMVTARDPELAERVRLLRNHGFAPKYESRVVGGNFRLDEIQAAVLRVKLKHLATWNESRRKNAARYQALFASAGLASEDGTGMIQLPAEADSCRHVFHQYVIRVAGGRRDALRQYLTERHIGTEVYYPVPLHLQECFRQFGYRRGDFPVSERASAEALALPIYPELTEAMQARVVTAISEFLEPP